MLSNMPEPRRALDSMLLRSFHDLDLRQVRFCQSDRSRRARIAASLAVGISISK